MARGFFLLAYFSLPEIFRFQSVLGTGLCY
jgi:hypothetical protein